MEGPPSDAESETVIATTTYITLPGTHTSETDAYSTTTTNEQMVVLHEPKSHHMHSSILGRRIECESYQLQPLPSTAGPPQTTTNGTQEAESPTTACGIVLGGLERKPGLVGPPIRGSPGIPSSNIYQPITENARESACCKVHTIVMDQTSADSVATVLEPGVEAHSERQHARLMSFCHDIWVTLGICLQMNKDCIFCILFFIAFIVSASFLTAFFYRTMTLNPQMFQYPVHPGRIYYI